LKYARIVGITRRCTGVSVTQVRHCRTTHKDTRLPPLPEPNDEQDAKWIPPEDLKKREKKQFPKNMHKFTRKEWQEYLVKEWEEARREEGENYGDWNLYKPGLYEEPQEEDFPKGKICDNKPYKMYLEAGKRYYWCSCGLSKKQPLCDGSHKKIGPEFMKFVKTAKKGFKFTPLEVSVEERKQVLFCNCKQSDNRPYCDGTHKKPDIQHAIVNGRPWYIIEINPKCD